MGTRPSARQAYRAFRDRVGDVLAVRGPLTTLALAKAVDPLWRAMLEARRETLRALKASGRITDQTPIRAEDFYAVFRMTVDDNNHAAVCPACLTECAPGECPVCGESVPERVATEVLKEIVVDLDLPEGRPNWDVDFTPPPDARLEKIRPVTKRDDIPGPKGTTGRKNKKHAFKLSKGAQAQKAWMRKWEFGRHVPYTVGRLQKMQIKDLRTIATLMPSYDRQTVRPMSFDELIRFILAHQGQAPIDPGPPPHGEIPTLPEVDE